MSSTASPSRSNLPKLLSLSPSLVYPVYITVILIFCNYWLHYLTPVHRNLPINIAEMVHAFSETDSLMSDTDTKKKRKFIKSCMTLIVGLVIKVSYGGLMKADN